MKKRKTKAEMDGLCQDNRDMIAIGTTKDDEVNDKTGCAELTTMVGWFSQLYRQCHIDVAKQIYILQPQVTIDYLCTCIFQTHIISFS